MTCAYLELEVEQPIFSYSLNLRIFSDVAIAMLVLVGSWYFYLVGDYALTPYPLLVIVLIVYDLSAYWRKPLRKIRFFDDGFEVSGWKENRKARYDELEYLSKVKRVIGDFRSGSVVWFSIKGDPNDFMVPNRKVGKPKVELYEWLLQKNPRAVQTRRPKIAHVSLDNSALSRLSQQNPSRSGRGAALLTLRRTAK